MRDLAHHHDGMLLCNVLMGAKNKSRSLPLCCLPAFFSFSCEIISRNSNKSFAIAKETFRLLSSSWRIFQTTFPIASRLAAEKVSRAGNYRGNCFSRVATLSRRSETFFIQFRLGRCFPTLLADASASKTQNLFTFFDMRAKLFQNDCS